MNLNINDITGDVASDSLENINKESKGSSLATNKRVLSIQSHVVYGYVGNKCATFPLQLHGFDVDSINTVQFSNHTRHPTYRGSVFDRNHLLDLLEGLEANNMLRDYTHVLTGYIGSSSILESTTKIIESIKRINPNVFVLVDPVLGDDGKFYVPVDVIPLYKSLLKQATLITPNLFEAEALISKKITTLDDAKTCIKMLNSMGAKMVVISSMIDPMDVSMLVLVGWDGTLENGFFAIRFPRIDSSFTGTGDLFASLVLANISNGLCTACEKAVTSMQAVLKRTLEKKMLYGEKSSKGLELQLIQSKKDLENGSVMYKSFQI
jgi:pyridoxine kinase